MTTEEALKAFGSKAAIAQALNISPQAVSYWKEKVPELRAYQLREILEQRAVKPEQSAA